MEYMSSQEDGFDELKPSLFGTRSPAMLRSQALTSDAATRAPLRTAAVLAAAAVPPLPPRRRDTPSPTLPITHPQLVR